MTRNENMAIAVATFVKQLIGANSMGASMKIARPLEKRDVYAKASHSNKGIEKSQIINRFFKGDESIITKVTEYSNVTFERDYESAVKRRATKNRKANGEKDVNESKIDFTSDSLKGMNWVEGWVNILAQSLTKEEQFYLRVAMNANSKVKTTYLVNGKEATAEELVIIKADLKENKRSYEKQYQAGVAVGDEVDVFVTKLQNLCYIKYGAKEIRLK